MARLRCVERRFDGMRQCHGPQRHLWLVSSSTVYHPAHPPATRTHTHSVWVSFDQGSHGHRPVTRHSAGMHVGASMLQCACMPTRIRCSRPLSPALPRALDHGKPTGLPSVGVTGTRKYAHRVWGRWHERRVFAFSHCAPHACIFGADSANDPRRQQVPCDEKSFFKVQAPQSSGAWVLAWGVCNLMTPLICADVARDEVPWITSLSLRSPFSISL